MPQETHPTLRSVLRLRQPPGSPAPSSPVVTLLKVMASETRPPRAMHIRSKSWSLVKRYWSFGRIWAKPRAAFVRGAMDTCGNRGKAALTGLGLPPQLPQTPSLQPEPAYFHHCLGVLQQPAHERMA